MRLPLLMAIAALLPALEVPTLRIPQVVAPPPLDAAAIAAPAWAKAALVPGLTQSVNREGKPRMAIPTTEVRLLWDAKALYIRFDCTDTDIYLPHDQHDELLYQGDVAEIFLDPLGDARQWFEIQVAANNATFDSNAVLTAEPQSDADGKLLSKVIERDLWQWNSYEMEGVKTAASKRADSWTVELAIPARSAAKRTGSAVWKKGMKLHANLMRYDWSKPDVKGSRALLPMNWAPVLDGCPHISPQAMGVLELVAEP